MTTAVTDNNPARKDAYGDLTTYGFIRAQVMTYARFKVNASNHHFVGALRFAGTKFESRVEHESNMCLDWRTEFHDARFMLDDLNILMKDVVDGLTVRIVMNLELTHGKEGLEEYIRKPEFLEAWGTIDV